MSSSLLTHLLTRNRQLQKGIFWPNIKYKPRSRTFNIIIFIFCNETTLISNSYQECLTRKSILDIFKAAAIEFEGFYRFVGFQINMHMYIYVWIEPFWLDS